MTQAVRAGARNGRYGIFGRGRADSLRLDVGRPDHLAPFLGIVGDELAEVGGRAGQHGTAQISEPRLDFGISQARIDLFVELVNNLGRRVFRGADAGPEDRLVAREQRFIFMADGQNNRVRIIVRETLEEVTAFGDGGRQPGQFYGVHSIATDSKGNVYTTETWEGKRLQKFVYKGIGNVMAANQGVLWPKR